MTKAEELKKNDVHILSFYLFLRVFSVILNNSV